MFSVTPAACCLPLSTTIQPSPLFAHPAGKEWRDFTHEQDELVVVVSGHMQFTIDQEVVQLEAGDECFIPAGK